MHIVYSIIFKTIKVRQNYFGKNNHINLLLIYYNYIFYQDVNNKQIDIKTSLKKCKPAAYPSKI